MSGIDYKCGVCNSRECKLWRPMAVFTNDVELICWECLEARGHKVGMTEDFRHDQIYDRAIESTNWGPAVPDLDGNWWVYTGVPAWWVAWWQALKDKASYCSACRGKKRIAEFECRQCDGTGFGPCENKESC